MGVMSIRIDKDKRRVLKVIAALEGKTMSAVVAELIDDYIRRNKKKLGLISEKSDLKNIMAMSEKSFLEWNNEEDEIYNDL